MVVVPVPETMLKLLWVKSPTKSNLCWVVPFVSVSFPTPETSEKLAKLHEPSRSTASDGAKPEMSPQKPLGSARSSVPPPVKPMSWEPIVLPLPTDEPNSQRRRARDRVGSRRGRRAAAHRPLEIERAGGDENRPVVRDFRRDRARSGSAGLFDEPGVADRRGRRRAALDSAVVEDVPGRSRGDGERGDVAGGVAHRRRAAGLDDPIRVVERRRPADRQAEAEDYGRSLGVQDVRAARRRSGEGVRSGQGQIAAREIQRRAGVPGERSSIGQVFIQRDGRPAPPQRPVRNRKLGAADERRAPTPEPQRPRAAHRPGNRRRSVEIELRSRVDRRLAERRWHLRASTSLRAPSLRSPARSTC